MITAIVAKSRSRLILGSLHDLVPVGSVLLAYLGNPGLQASWKTLEFPPHFSAPQKILDFGPGKLWKSELEVLEHIWCQIFRNFVAQHTCR